MSYDWRLKCWWVMLIRWDVTWLIRCIVMHMVCGRRVELYHPTCHWKTKMQPDFDVSPLGSIIYYNLKATLRSNCHGPNMSPPEKDSGNSTFLLVYDFWFSDFLSSLKFLGSNKFPSFFLLGLDFLALSWSRLHFLELWPNKLPFQQ